MPLKSRVVETPATQGPLPKRIVDVVGVGVGVGVTICPRCGSSIKDAGAAGSSLCSLPPFRPDEVVESDPDMTARIHSSGDGE